jgi:exopolysaccharide biosynthesis WecB/TagA/CpsF family protein
MSPQNGQTVILGVPVDNLNMNLAVDRIMNMIGQYAVDKKERLVATANVDFIVNANRKERPETIDSLRSILRNADLVTADGMPLVWLSQLLGTPLSERVTGADLVPELAKRAAEQGKSIYLLGGKNGSAKATAKILQARHPSLKIAGFSAPMIDLDDEMENIIEIARINITAPDILLIALGNPKQEFWFERYRDSLKVAVSIGVGGTFEFIAGMTSRAPVWMQKGGVEWMYRITQDPGRLIKRYANGLFSFNVMAFPLIIMNRLVQLLSRNKNGEAYVGAFDCSDEKTMQELPQGLLGQLGNIGVFASHKTLTLDFSTKRSLQPTEVLALMKLSLWAQNNECDLTIFNMNWFSRALLKFYRVADLLAKNIAASDDRPAHQALQLAS